MVVAVVVLAISLVAVVATAVYLIRQRRYYAPAPSDLRRADDEGHGEYSEYEQGHDITTGFVERGGSF